MASLDDYLQELRAQLQRVSKRGATSIIVAASELRLAVGNGRWEGELL